MYPPVTNEALAQRSALAEGAPEAIDPHATMQSQGSGTNSYFGMEEDGVILAPTLVDIKRLRKLKADQEQRLKSLTVRVDRLTAQEQKVWKDVANTQQRSLQVQEKQWARQASQAEKIRMERELMLQEQALRERARDMRETSIHMKDGPRQARFAHNKAISQQIREDSRRNEAALRRYREQTVEEKRRIVELRTQQRRKATLERDLQESNQKRAQSDMHALRYAELQEELRNCEMAIEIAEREEITTLERLKNSTRLREQVEEQLRDLERRSPNSSPRLVSPLSEDGVEALSPPPPFSRVQARSTRSSPRLNSPTGISSYGASARGRVSMHGSRSAASVGRMDLTQITEEESGVSSKSAGSTHKKMSPPPGSRLRGSASQQRTRQSPGRPSSNGMVRGPIDE